jgi:hypothetical protein
VRLRSSCTSPTLSPTPIASEAATPAMATSFRTTSPTKPGPGLRPIRAMQPWLPDWIGMSASFLTN